MINFKQLLSPQIKRTALICTWDSNNIYILKQSEQFKEVKVSKKNYKIEELTDLCSAISWEKHGSGCYSAAIKIGARWIRSPAPEFQRLSIRTRAGANKRSIWECTNSVLTITTSRRFMIGTRRRKHDAGRLANYFRHGWIVRWFQKPDFEKFENWELKILIVFQERKL